MVMSKPRGHRSAQLPRDPARLLRALRACRHAVIEATGEVRIGGALHIAGGALTGAIDALAKILTGSPEYFWGNGGGTTDQQRSHRRKWDAIERGEEPWPR